MLGNAFRLVFPADHEARDVLQEKERNAPLAGELDEMRALERTFGKQHPVIGEDRHRHAPDMRESADQRGAVMLLELVEFAAVDDPRDHFVHIVRRAHIIGHNRIEIVGGEFGRARIAQFQIPGRCRVRAEMTDDIAHDGERVFVIFGKVIDHARFLRVEIAAAQILGADLLARRRLYERRSGKEDGALIAHDYRLVAHCGHVGPARGAAAHHAGDLRDAQRGHIGLVEEDAPEMVAIRKHFGLVRQVGAAAVDQIDARQPVFLRNLLRAQMLLDRHRVIGAALHRGIVAHDHALAPRDPPDPGDHPRAGDVVPVIQAIGSELADLEKGRTRIEQPLDTFSREEFAARGVALTRFLRPAERGFSNLGAQLVGQRLVVRKPHPGLGAVAVERGGESGCGHFARCFFFFTIR